MEYLQYFKVSSKSATCCCFKPYYKWNTFNTRKKSVFKRGVDSFKPYYKWNTFNTPDVKYVGIIEEVLNLIINGIPSILYENFRCNWRDKVLNLIINGIPSIPHFVHLLKKMSYCFKPYYKWNTFNTLKTKENDVNEKSFKPYYKWNTFNTL